MTGDLEKKPSNHFLRSGHQKVVLKERSFADWLTFWLKSIYAFFFASIIVWFTLFVPLFIIVLLIQSVGR